MVGKAIKRLWYFIFGNIFSVFLYKRKYLKGKYFKSKYGCVFAPGWKWVYHDAIGRMILGSNKGVPWPVNPTSSVIGWENIIFNKDDLQIFQGNGIYFQAMGGEIRIGNGTWIGPGAGLICSNHDLTDLEARAPGKDIIIGDNSWIGMNAVVLPGVELGNNTIVGAGSVVTKSFKTGDCVIAGNPAVIIKKTVMK